jgi:predicted XRE-type DNA-binding protein
MKKAREQVFANVWDAIVDSPAESASLELRYQLMEKISGIVKQNGWTQAEAAKRCGVSQPRINDLLRGRIARFSVDALVNIASALGSRIRLTLEDAA